MNFSILRQLIQVFKVSLDPKTLGHSSIERNIIIRNVKKMQVSFQKDSNTLLKRRRHA